MAASLLVPGREEIYLATQAGFEVADVWFGQGDGAGPDSGSVAVRRFVRVVLDYWFCGCLEQSQGAAQDIGLELRVVGNAQRPSERERYPEGSRWIDDFSVLADQTDPGGGDPVLFEEVREGTDGTRAGWSNGCQHGAMHTGVV